MAVPVFLLGGEVCLQTARRRAVWAVSDVFYRHQSRPDSRLACMHIRSIRSSQAASDIIKRVNKRDHERRERICSYVTS